MKETGSPSASGEDDMGDIGRALRICLAVDAVLFVLAFSYRCLMQQ